MRGRISGRKRGWRTWEVKEKVYEVRKHERAEEQMGSKVKEICKRDIRKSGNFEAR